jgi:hypothetical protein
MKLELRRATDGTHFVICIVSEQAKKQIVVPLSPTLSSEIYQMTMAEGFGTEKLILPPGLRAN